MVLTATTAMRGSGLASVFCNQEEQSEPVFANIQGKIPEWIKGSYLRVGPGKFDIGDTTMNHFIDGYAMLSKFDIQDGIVTFTKRFLQSEAYKKAIEFKKPILPEFSTKGNPGEGKNFINRVIGAFGSSGITDNDSLNLYTIEGEVYAASETCHIHNILPTDLSTTENKIDFYKVFGIYMATAHPLRCKKTGDLYNIGTRFKPTCKYQVMRIPNLNGQNVKNAIKKSEVIATIYPSWNTYISYYHSFAMTENYIVMLEQPLLCNIIKMAEAKLVGKGVRDAMEWHPNEKTRFHIVDKRTGEVFKTKYYSQEPFFYFHIANSFEDEHNNIVMDIDTYDNDDVMDRMIIERLRKEDLSDDNPAHMQRFVLPLIKNVKDVPKDVNLIEGDSTRAIAVKDEHNSIIVAGQHIGKPGFEGPIINPNLQAKKHRYIYGTGSCLPGYYSNAICKLDMETGNVKLWRENKTTYPGEPIFLPSPNSRGGEEEEEDSGILMTAVSESTKGKQDYLVFINANTMKEVARANVSVQIPQAIHGVFL